MNIKHVILTGITLLFTAFAWAQQGTVTVYQDDRLGTLLYQEKNNTAQTPKEAIVANGYRVQVYSSNAARKAKETALEWKKTIEEAFPQLRAYVQYQAPFWKVRVGDFTHYAAAVLCSKQLQQAYPDKAGEIIIVKEKQVKPLYFEEQITPTTTDSLRIATK